MLDMVNAENIAADQEGWFKIDPEEIVSRNPDVIISYVQLCRRNCRKSEST